MTPEFDRRLQLAKERLTAPIDPSEAQRSLLRFKRLQQRRRRRHMLAAGASIAIAAGGACAYLLLRHTPPTISPIVSVASTDDAVVRPRSVYFPDGSHADLLRPDTELRMESVSDDLLELTMTAGEAHFDVKPDKRRLFRVRTQDLRIEVLGTSFTVLQWDNQTSVTVHEGRVAVYQDDRRHELGRGTTAYFDVAESPSPTAQKALLDASRASGADADERRRTKTDSDLSPQSATRHAPDGNGDDAGHEEDRHNREAGPARPAADVDAPSIVAPPTRAQKRPVKNRRRVEPSRAGNSSEVRQRRPDRTPSGDETQDLMLAADVARLAGRPRKAVRYLQRVVKEHPAHPRAVPAAFTLGRILRHELNAPRRAAAAFRRAYDLAPNGSLAEDALANEVDCWNYIGDYERAASRARTYLRRFPGGRKADRMRTLGARP